MAVSTRQHALQFYLSELEDRDVLIRKNAISQVDAIANFLGPEDTITKILPKVKELARKDEEVIRHEIALMLPKLFKRLKPTQYVNCIPVFQELNLNLTDSVVRLESEKSITLIINAWLSYAHEEPVSEQCVEEAMVLYESLYLSVENMTKSASVHARILSVKYIPLLLKILSSPPLANLSAIRDQVRVGSLEAPPAMVESSTSSHDYPRAKSQRRNTVDSSIDCQAVNINIETSAKASENEAVVKNLQSLISCYTGLSRDKFAMVRVAACEVYPLILDALAHTADNEQRWKINAKENDRPPILLCADELLRDPDETVYASALSGCMIPFVKYKTLCEDSALISLMHKVVHESQLSWSAKKKVPDAIRHVLETRYLGMLTTCPAAAEQLVEDYCHLLGPFMGAAVRKEAASILPLICSKTAHETFSDKLFPAVLRLIADPDESVRKYVVGICDQVLLSCGERLKGGLGAGDMGALETFGAQKNEIIKACLNLLSDTSHQVRDHAVSVFVAKILPYVTCHQERIDLVNKLYKGVSALEAPWRVVAAVLNTVPQTCTLLGDAWWEEAGGLSFVQFGLFHPNVDGIRKCAMKQLVYLQSRYGLKKIEDQIVPKLISYSNGKSKKPYMVRIACVVVAKELILNLRETDVNQVRQLEQRLREVFIRAVKDPVPNVRRVAMVAVADLLDFENTEELMGVSKLLSTPSMNSEPDEDVQKVRMIVLNLVSKSLEKIA